MDSTRGGMSTVGISSGNDGTFIINGPQGGPTTGNMAARLQIPSAELNHMFSPLALERMFQRAPSSNLGSSTNNTASIAGMLWNGNGDALDEQGKTLQLLLMNGSNPETGEQPQIVTPVSPPNHIASPPISLRGAESAFERARPSTARIEQFPAPLPTNSRRPMSMYDIQTSGVDGGTPTTGFHAQQHPQSAGVPLRHEVLGRIARQSQPSTPLLARRSPHMTTIHPVTTMQPMVPTQPLMGNHVSRSSHGRASAVPELMGGRPRAYTYTSETPAQPPHAARAGRAPGHHKALSQVAMGISRPSSVPGNGVRRTVDVPGVVRKGSDGSNVRLIKPDPKMPLPNRVGDMVLDRDAGWVNINEVQAGASPVEYDATHSLDSEIRRGDTIMPGSGRSTLSTASRGSAFPGQLPPVAGRSPLVSFGMRTHVVSGLPSPANDVQATRPVHEMSERKVLERADSAYGTATSRDDGMGSIVNKLVTAPAGMPATAVALNGVGIRSIKALPKLPTNIETMALDNNKLQSLVGLPMGLVNLTVSGNWLTLGSIEASRFSFARELPHLEFLDLSSNEISDISVVSGLRHLRRLVVNRARITSMKGLVGCRRLEQLTLRDNAIAEFDLDPSQMPLLTSLDLCNNRLRVLPARISELVHLRALNVDRNDLEFVDLLGAPSNVRELRVSENPRMLRQSAGIVDARAWHKKFPRLRTLYMDTCYAKQVVNGMTASSDLTGAQVWPGLCNLSLRGYVTLPSLSIDFSCLQHLRNLYLPDTKVNLPHVMPTLPHLRQLVLSNAGLQRLPVNLGSALPLLQHLDISNNPELTDLSPIMHISTLEVLRAQSIGITHPTPPAPLYNADGLEEFPPINNTFSELQASQVPDECAILQMFSRLRRLRVIDLRFNKVTEDMYAPAEVPSPEAATPVTAASSSVFGAQMEMVGASEGFRGGLRPRSDTTASAMSAPPQVGFVEAVWQKCDNKYVDLLKRTGRGHVIQRREQYWDLAIRLFPNLQVLDGSKVPLH